MDFNEALAKILDAIEDVSVYDEELDVLRNGNNSVKPEDSEVYKDLSEKYETLKAKYKKKFIDSLTDEIKTDREDSKDDETEDVQNDGNIDFSDLDLSGEND